ncbi:type II toxin-antitoxin system RelE/ParE family toxin [Nostoc cf. edaphicum LEGE 07299]|uniref:Type II toxin-antitoxin system RelE/ParE family toxin n=1 Tax=Nostoc cf. edaphicum LEGE 07299 TaxID=2777974 RepID=A0ABR9TTB1_9NOSO|nr:type II toxin-antitoxin system RelE/ParE family toxin [Nostoc edaphicum]MBE9103641.1 type II toxin-antitoxin system RelE/ParE family toxin [Nostoc cf. edaphicum LEGE 07299]
MAYQVVWSSKALEDVEAIATYISRDSTAYAAAVVQRIIDVTRHLSNFPFSGRIVPEFDDDNIREKFVYSYRVIYRIQGDTLTIAAVIHGKRLLEKLDADSE